MLKYLYQHIARYLLLASNHFSIQPKFNLYSLGTLITSMINAKSRKNKFIFSFSVRLNNCFLLCFDVLSTLSNFVKVIGWNTISSQNLFITGCSVSEGFVLSSIMPKNIWVNLRNNLSSYFGLIDERMNYSYKVQPEKKIKIDS